MLIMLITASFQAAISGDHAAKDQAVEGVVPRHQERVRLRSLYFRVDLQRVRRGGLRR